MMVLIRVAWTRAMLWRYALFRNSRGGGSSVCTPCVCALTADVDEGDVVEVRLVPEFEGWRLLGVYALCVCVDSSGCAVGLMVGDGF